MNWQTIVPNVPYLNIHHATGAGNFYSAGISIANALVYARRFLLDGFRPVFVHVGNGTLDREQAAKTAGTYIHLMKEMKINELAADISLRPGAFRIVGPRSIHRHNAWQTDFPEICSVLTQAQKLTTRTWLNAELLETRRDLWLLAEQTLLYGTADFVGLTFQAYGQRPFHSTKFWERRVVPFIRRIPSGKTIGLRLCKGAHFSDLSTYRNQQIIADRCLDLAEKILNLLRDFGKDGHNAFYPEFATHDPELIGRIISKAEQRGISRMWFRFAMMLGRKQDLASYLASQGFRVAIHIPFGDPFAGEGKYHDCDAGRCHKSADLGLI